MKKYAVENITIIGYNKIIIEIDNNTSSDKQQQNNCRTCNNSYLHILENRLISLIFFSLSK